MQWSTTARFGRSVCRLFRELPLVFALFVCAGIAAGVWLVLHALRLPPIGLIFLGLFGIACVLFYITLLWFFISRTSAGTWDKACDYGIEVFGDDPEWRRDLVFIDQVNPSNISTGIEIHRVCDLVGVRRTLIVVVDGIEIGHIRHGARQPFVISPGSHEVQVQMDFCCSERIHIGVKEGQLTKLRCGARLRYLFPLNMMLLAITPGSFYFIEVLPE